MPAHKPNVIVENGEYCEVVITNKQGDEVARSLIDNDDVPLIMGVRWSIDSGGYARSRRGRMHQVVMRTRGYDRIVDHISGNRMDNRKSNLRYATQSENNHHRPMKRNNKSGAIGVIRVERVRKWAAYIGAHGKRYHIGYFSSFDDAVAARDKKAKELFREFAYTNTSHS